MKSIVRWFEKEDKHKDTENLVRSVNNFKIFVSFSKISVGIFLPATEMA